MSESRRTVKTSLQLWVRVSRMQCGDSRKDRMKRAIGEHWQIPCLLTSALEHSGRDRVVQTFLPYVQLLNAMLNVGDPCVRGFCQATIRISTRFPRRL